MWRAKTVLKLRPDLVVTTTLSSSQVHESFHKHLKPLQAKLWSLLVLENAHFSWPENGCWHPFLRHLNQTFQILVAVGQWIIVATLSTFINRGVWGECVGIDACVFFLSAIIMVKLTFWKVWKALWIHTRIAFVKLLTREKLMSTGKVAGFYY